MIKERIDILEQASVISVKVGDYTKKVIDLLEPQFLKNETGLETFTTHLAMATQRILSNDEVALLDDQIWDEVVASPNYAQAEQMYQKMILQAPCTYPEGERRFLIMHLCNLYQY